MNKKKELTGMGANIKKVQDTYSSVIISHNASSFLIPSEVLSQKKTKVKVNMDVQFHSQ